MPEIDLHTRCFDDGTKTKLDIFGKYLEEWLPVFIHNQYCDNVTICDFFAGPGPGSDSKGNPGSPLIILEVIKKFSNQIKQKGL
ncbi:MAG: three-Cys-motif partner protein TcmP [Desulfobulbaceae bacterium]|nr:three-Cys-motif partner protein TcmP [Desulfobulbaceae bacterium]